MDPSIFYLTQDIPKLVIIATGNQFQKKKKKIKEHSHESEEKSKETNLMLHSNSSQVCCPETVSWTSGTTASHQSSVQAGLLIWSWPHMVALGVQHATPATVIGLGPSLTMLDSPRAPG